MARDWIAILKEQSQLVQQMAKGLSRACTHPDLTAEQAFQIYRIVQKGVENFDLIREDMNRHTLGDRLYIAADRLRDIWAGLSVSAASKVRTMHGLDVVDLPETHKQ